MKHFYCANQISGSPDKLPDLSLLIVAAGSDNRAYKVLQEYSTNNRKIEKVLVVDFSERTEGITDADYLDRYFSYRNLQLTFEEVKVSVKEPSRFIKDIDKGFNGLIEYDKIGVDISCFTKPFFFALLKYIQICSAQPHISVFYTEPKTYLFHQGLYQSYKSSSGPTRVEELPSFTGSNRNEKERVLIVLLGFDGDLSKEIHIDVAPNTTIIVNGFPSYDPKFKDVSLINNERLVTNNSNNLFFCRANNPFDCYNLLEEITAKVKPNTFVNIAPLGPKPMALGACLFGIHNPKVRVVYPIPEKYENETTDDSYTSWHYESPLVLQ